MALFTLFFCEFLIILAFLSLSLVRAKEFPLGLSRKPSPSMGLDLEISEFEIVGFQSVIPELSDNSTITNNLFEIFNSWEDWDESNQFQETPELSKDFEELHVKYQPTGKMLSNSGFRQIRKEKEERIRGKRQILNIFYPRQRQLRRRTRYQTNNRRRAGYQTYNRRNNQNIRGNSRPNQYRQVRVYNRGNYNRITQNMQTNQFGRNQRNRNFAQMRNTLRYSPSRVRGRDFTHDSDTYDSYVSSISAASIQSYSY